MPVEDRVMRKERRERRKRGREGQREREIRNICTAIFLDPKIKSLIIIIFFLERK